MKVQLCTRLDSWQCKSPKSLSLGIRLLGTRPTIAGGGRSSLLYTASQSRPLKNTCCLISSPSLRAPSRRAGSLMSSYINLTSLMSSLASTDRLVGILSLPLWMLLSSSSLLDEK